MLLDNLYKQVRNTQSPILLTMDKLVYFLTRDPDMMKVLRSFGLKDGPFNDLLEDIRDRISDIDASYAQLLHNLSNQPSQVVQNHLAKQGILPTKFFADKMNSETVRRENLTVNMTHDAVDVLSLFVEFKQTATLQNEYEFILLLLYTVMAKTQNSLHVELQQAGLRWDNINNSVKSQLQQKNASSGNKKTVNSKNQKDSMQNSSDDMPNELIDLTALVSEGKLSHAIGRADEINTMLEILNQLKKTSVALVGKAGVGKTAIVEGLAVLIQEGKVPEMFKNAKVYLLEMSSLMMQTGLRGSFEEKLEQIKNFLAAQRESGIIPILFIDELHSIVGAGATAGNEGSSLGNYLKPMLARGEIYLIGATTDKEWVSIKKDKALSRRFMQVEIREPSRDQAIEIVSKSLSSFEKKHGVKYSKESIEKAVDLSIECMPTLALPDKAFDIIDRAGSQMNMKKQKKVSIDAVCEAVHSLTKIPLATVLKQNAKIEHSLRLNDYLRSKIFNQEEAITLISKAVDRHLAKVKDPNKPIGSFLMVGNTGVGKTQIAKDTADYLNAHFMRIDMSEYAEGHTISRLIGSPAGYVGHDKESLLQEINKYPFSVLLLDEIEKAHPVVHQLFLQAMDNGKITDASGEPIFLNNTLILMSSNVGAQEASRPVIGFNQSSDISHGKRESAVAKMFAPEFRNRLTAVIHFNPLPTEVMYQIIDKDVAEFLKFPGMESRKLSLEISKDVKDKIVADAVHENLGARPIKRYLNDYVFNYITEEMVYGSLRDENQNKQILVTLKDDKVSFEITDNKSAPVLPELALSEVAPELAKPKKTRAKKVKE